MQGDGVEIDVGTNGRDHILFEWHFCGSLLSVVCQTHALQTRCLLLFNVVDFVSR